MIAFILAGLILTHANTQCVVDNTALAPYDQMVTDIENNGTFNFYQWRANIAAAKAIRDDFIRHHPMPLVCSKRLAWLPGGES